MHLHTLFQDQNARDSRFWVRICTAIGFGALVLYVFGPLPFVAYGLQRWASASRWDWMDRWASVRAFAVSGEALFVLIGGLLVVPFPFFRLMLRALWVHLPLLGTFSLVPLSFANVPARWLLLLPFAPALALLFERVLPRTTGYLMRVLLPHEVAHLRQQQQVAAAIALAERANATPVAAPKPKQRRAVSTRKKPAKSKSMQVVQGSSPQGIAEHPASGEQTSPQVVLITPSIDWSQVEE